MSILKPRNFLVPLMRTTRKAKAFVDKKKEQRRKFCREKIRYDREY